MALSNEKPAAEGLLTLREVSDWLEVSEKKARQLVARRLLVPVSEDGEPRFDPNDVADTARALKKNIGVAGMYQHALQALTIASRTERKLDALLDALGGSHHPVSTEPHDIIALHHACLSLECADTSIMTALQIRGWAKLFLGMDRNYFKAADAMRNGFSSYRAPLDAAAKMLREAPLHIERTDADRATSYAILRTAYATLRQEAYLYLRETGGKAVADRAFPNPKTTHVNAVILSLL